MSRILAVEDSSSIRLLLRRRLERAGHTVRTAAVPAEALAALDGAPADQRPELILLDLGLAGGDGLGLLRALTEVAPGVPVVLLSAHPGLDRLELPVEVAARLAKPIDFDRLLGLIETLAAG